MFTGLAGYGVSLVLFVVALRNLGTTHRRVLFSRAAIRRDAFADPVAGYAGAVVLGGRRVDGARRVAAYS